MFATLSSLISSDAALLTLPVSPLLLLLPLALTWRMSRRGRRKLSFFFELVRVFGWSSKLRSRADHVLRRQIQFEKASRRGGDPGPG